MLCQAPPGRQTATCVGPMGDRGLGYMCLHCGRVRESRMRRFIGQTLAQRDVLHKSSSAPGTPSDPSHIWSYYVRHTLADLFGKLMDQGPWKPSGRFAICIAGSLAYNEGSYYSDIDSFAVLEKKEDQKGMLDLGNRAFVWLADAFTRASVMQPDKDIFPSAMADTIEDLLSSPKYAGLPNWLGMLKGSEFVFGDRKLFDKFRGAMARVTPAEVKQRQLRALADMEAALLQFNEPLWGKTEAIDLKDDIYRSLSLILNALARFHNLPIAALSSAAIARQLVDAKRMSPEVAAVVTDAWRNYEKARNSLHMRFKTEQYRVQWNPAQPQAAKRPPEPNASEKLAIDEAIRSVKVIRRIARSFIALYFKGSAPAYHDDDAFLSKTPRVSYRPGDDTLVRNFEKNKKKRTPSMEISLERVRKFIDM